MCTKKYYFLLCALLTLGCGGGTGEIDEHDVEATLAGYGYKRDIGAAAGQLVSIARDAAFRARLQCRMSDDDARAFGLMYVADAYLGKAYFCDDQSDATRQAWYEASGLYSDTAEATNCWFYASGDWYAGATSECVSDFLE